MITAPIPKYQWGQRVRAAGDLFNDGTFPDAPVDALLVQAGDAGEIVQVGTHVDSNTVIYLVAFAETRVVGCFEDEISPFEGAAASAPPPAA